MERRVVNENNLFEWIMGGVVTLIAWLGNRLHIRVDSIESSRAKNEDLNAVRADINALRAHVDAKFDAQTTQIMSVMRDHR